MFAFRRNPAPDFPQDAPLLAARYASLAAAGVGTLLTLKKR